MNNRNNLSFIKLVPTVKATSVSCSYKLKLELLKVLKILYSLTYLQDVSYFSPKMTILQTMATYATLWTISDSVEQKFISKKEQMDYKKSVRMVTVGTFVVAPLVFTWMFLAERMFPGRAIKTVAKKMITDQVVFAPVAISTFYFTTCMLERKSLQQFKEEWLVKFPITYKTGMMFWPFVQAVNFSVVPYKHRAKVIGCASFLWSMFLCYEKEPSEPENMKQGS